MEGAGEPGQPVNRHFSSFPVKPSGGWGEGCKVVVEVIVGIPGGSWKLLI